MGVRNLDYECFVSAREQQASHQEDWLKGGYAPKGFCLKDFCLTRVGREWHLFHIASVPGVSCCLPGNEMWFGHATTTDFCSWTTHLPCFYVDPSSWDCGHVFAPYVIEHDGQYWMLYTGCAIDNTQRIGVAVSDNLFDWTRAAPGPVIRPEEYGWAFCPTTKGSACRDPHVVRTEDGFLMYYTAVTKEGRGCVATAWSRDLLAWEDRGPAYAAPTLAHCESSNMQPLGGKYLLFFGGHYAYWSYVVSNNPFRWPPQEPTPLRRGITAMEVLLRCDRKWLVAYFKMDNYRMFLGTIDWSAPAPAIEEVTDAETLRRVIRDLDSGSGAASTAG
jgi:predicted GH43/DUF377 family glycosyl hydrolase